MKRVSEKQLAANRANAARSTGPCAVSEGFDRIAQSSNIWSVILRCQSQVERLRRNFPNEAISDPEPEETKEETPTQNEPIPSGETAARPANHGAKRLHGSRSLAADPSRPRIIHPLLK